MTLKDYSARLAALGGVVWRMEDRGVPISLDVCHEIASQARADAAQTRAWLDHYLGAYTGRLPWHHNWNYHTWLVDILHGPAPAGLGIKPSPYGAKGPTKGGKVATDSRALEYMAAVTPEHRQFLNAVRTLRRQDRVAGYAESWIALAVHHPDGTDRLHPSYGMANDADDRPGAKTGRFGLKNPPLQQVPIDKRKDPYRLRRAFVAPPGHVLVVADYSQLEVVILAHLAVILFGDRTLADRLAPGQPDLHSATAKFVFGEVLGSAAMAQADVAALKGHPTLGGFRDRVKAVRYGLNYRKGAWGFGNTLFEVDDRGEIAGPPLGERRAQELIDALYRFDPEIPAYHAWVDDYIRDNSCMPSLLGRWFPFPEANSPHEWERKKAGRRAANWPMQAGGQEITAAAMIALDALGAEMTLQVHDELHVLAREDRVDRVMAAVKREMEGAVPLRAPLIAKPGHGPSWEAAK